MDILLCYIKGYMAAVILALGGYYGYFISIKSQKSYIVLVSYSMHMILIIKHSTHETWIIILV